MTDNWISVVTRYPEDGHRVLVFDARYGEACVAWNAWWHRVGGASSPGKLVMPSGDTEDMHITHWMELPNAPKG